MGHHTLRNVGFAGGGIYRVSHKTLSVFNFAITRLIMPRGISYWHFSTALSVSCWKWSDQTLHRWTAWGNKSIWSIPFPKRNWLLTPLICGNKTITWLNKGKRCLCLSTHGNYNGSNIYWINKEKRGSRSWKFPEIVGMTPWFPSWAGNRALVPNDLGNGITFRFPSMLGSGCRFLSWVGNHSHFLRA